MTALADLVELVRAPAALSVPGDLVAGAAAAGTLGPRTAGMAAAGALLYWAGMAANDWADRDLDAVERPERPIPSGRVAPGTALALAAGLTAAGVAAAGLTGGRRGLAVAVPLAGAVWTYDLAAKNGPVGPAVMAGCRALDVLLGTDGRLRPALPTALAVAAHTWTVTALSRAEVHGAQRSLPCATLTATAALAAAAAGRRARSPAAALACWYGADYGSAQAGALLSPSASRIRTAVTAGITGLPALQAALTARSGRSGTALGVALAAGLGRSLSRKVSPT